VKIKHMICLLTLGAMLIGCTAVPQATGEPSAAYRKITAEQAKAKMDETDGWILLDVRTAAEFEEAHIAGAMLIPDDEITARVAEEIPDQDAMIFIYCRSGRRSASAAQAMADMGYTNVHDFGGIIDWPYEVVRRQ